MHQLICFTDILDALFRKESLKNLQTTSQIVPILC